MAGSPFVWARVVNDALNTNANAARMIVLVFIMLSIYVFMTFVSSSQYTPTLSWFNESEGLLSAPLTSQINARVDRQMSPPGKRLSQIVTSKNPLGFASSE